MKNWIPSYKGAHVSWDFKSGKENSRGKNNESKTRGFLSVENLLCQAVDELSTLESFGVMKLFNAETAVLFEGIRERLAIKE